MCKYVRIITAIRSKLNYYYHTGYAFSLNPKHMLYMYNISVLNIMPFDCLYKSTYK